MAKSKKQAADVLGDLMSQPAPAEPLNRKRDDVEVVPTHPIVVATAPKSLEYRPVGSLDKWMVEKFELLSVEMGLQPEGSPESFRGSGQRTEDSVGNEDDGCLGAWEKEMALFHGAAAEYSRGWLMVRRLFGVRPIIPPADAHMDDLEVQSREEVCRTLGLDKEQLQAELDAVRARWGQELQKLQGLQALPKEEAPENKKGELEFGDEVLKEFGFSERMFQLKMYDPVSKTEQERPPEENRAERTWFAQRITDWRKMLQEPMASALTREALMNDLYLRRLGTEMTTLSPTNPKFENMRRSKADMEEAYQNQLEQLQVMFPELNIAGKISFKAQISDVFKAWREYHARKDTQLIDRVRTAGEIEVELRQSVQAPEARYRFSLNVAIVEARHGLFDPNFRSQFRPSTLKKLDQGFRKAVEEVRLAEGEALVDLEDGVMPGEGSEYEDIPDEVEMT